jgi:hypothetical protein
MKYTLKNKDIELTDEELDELNAQRDEMVEELKRRGVITNGEVVN